MPIEPVAKVICLTRICQGKTIVDAFKPLENLYMIICGEVIVSIPNPKVQNWQEQNKKYKELIDWNHHVLNDKILTYVKSQLGEIKDYE